jgi:enamine deaminase RidA (YjgF/YER057c/UK114 family)
MEEHMSYEAKLRELGYVIEPIDLNAGKIMHAVRTGNLIYTSGQVSRWGDREVKGKLGGDLTVEQGYEAARFSTLSALRAIKTLAGSLETIVQVVKVLGMVNVAPDFDNTPAVIHGCSDLLLEVFGEAGRHARSAVGMTIPLNYAVEIELIVEVQ